MDYYYSIGATDIDELGKPYDLMVHGLGEDRHVEVKGSTARLNGIELTINEVAHARNYPHTDLVVVDEITCVENGAGMYAAAGGTVTVYAAWAPDEVDLLPSRYLYRLPDGGEEWES